jgi:hypothetical protein
MRKENDMLIEDGKGRGYKAAVTPENKMDVCAVVRTIDLFCNQAKGISYSLLISQTPTGAGDCFCYIKNNDEKDVVVSSIKLYAATDEVFTVKLNDTGTSSGGSAASPVNRKAGCGNVADITCETGNDITGLSGGDAVETIFVNGDESSNRYEWLSCLIIPKNHTMTLYVTNGAIAIRATLSMHFCECL